MNCRLCPASYTYSKLVIQSLFKNLAQTSCAPNTNTGSRTDCSEQNINPSLWQGRDEGRLDGRTDGWTKVGLGA